MDIAFSLTRPAATPGPALALRERTAPAAPAASGSAERPAPAGDAGSGLAGDLAARAAAAEEEAVSFAEGIRTAAREAEGQVEAMKRSLHDSIIQALRLVGLSRREAEAWAKEVVGNIAESKEDELSAAGRQAVVQARSSEVRLTFEVENISLRAAADGRGVSVDASRVTLRLSASTTVATLRGGAGRGAEREAPPEDPLVLDLDGNGIDLTTADRGIFWDLTGNGTPEHIAWVTGGDALLALDRNRNGRIDDGRELFGDQHGARDGLAELAKFDGNADGAIDAADPVFDSLVLLRPDFSTADLRSAGIERIRLDLAVPVGRRLAGGTIDAAAPVERTGGGTIAAAAVRLDVRA